MRTKAIITLVLPLLFIGAGCQKTVDEAAKPIEVPLAALQDAQELSADIAAQTRRQADSQVNLLPVAVVLAEGHDEPTEGVERLADETFGCEDRIGYVRVSRETATDDVLLDALNTLFSVAEPQLHGMLNSLWESEVQVEKIGGDGLTAKIYLTGNLMSPGVCADPRIKEQVEATVRQYRPNYEIIFNGSEANWRCFGDGSGLCE